jgi:hypothetical protein
MASAKKKTAMPNVPKTSTIDYKAIRRRLQMVQEVGTYTGHCVITDAEIDKAMHKGTSLHLNDFCQRYGQSIDWIMFGDLTGMIARRIVDAGASVRDKVS